MSASRERLLLLFFQEPPEDRAVRHSIGAIAGLKEAYWAKGDALSREAAMWTRDPLGCLPTARLALDCQQLPEASSIAKITAALGGVLYRCTGRSPLPVTLPPGSTFAGTLQLCAFHRRNGLSDAQLETLWLEEHTEVAIDTQCTLGYHQNWVVEGGPPYFDGLVEEYFPPAASTSMEAFFADGDNSDLMWRHVQRLTESSERFLDLDRSEVIHLTDTRIF